MNSNALFAKQVEAHSRTLSELLTAPNGAAVTANIVEHVLVTTRMLAGSASLMSLSDWEGLLRSFEALLVRYSSNHYPWDERVAQVTSEIIEKEEAFNFAFAENPSGQLTHFVDGVELSALVNEVTVLEEECDAGVWPENIPDETSAEASSMAADLYEIGASDAHDFEEPMAGVIEEFARVSRELCEQFAAYPKPGEAEDTFVEGVLESIGMARFYIESLDGYVLRSHAGNDRSHLCKVNLLRATMNGYAAELSAATDSELHVTVECDEVMRVDDTTLVATNTILQSMVRDIFQHRDGQMIEVTARAVERFGTIHWAVSDNANNFVSDSQFDREDQLAFYPSLKNVIHIVGENHGLLWVEPDNGQESRFEFRLPRLSQPGTLRVWGSDANAFAIRASQICEFAAVGADSVCSDTHGEFVINDGRRVPLVWLDTLYPEAKADGEVIVIAGSVEKRVAFYVSNEGIAANGLINGDVNPVWEAHPCSVVIHDGSRVSLLDANDIVGRYLTATGTFTPRGVSGGATENDMDYLQSQAAFKANVTAPPDRFPVDSSSSDNEANALRVLVVEQSDSMRDEFASVLARDGLTAMYAQGADEAIDLLGSFVPSLIISEFRMPTMAAKRLAEALRDQGKSIPVLVTTSQNGQTAELLVEKLGVSGYLSKPLVAEEVSRHLDTYLGPRVRS